VIYWERGRLARNVRAARTREKAGVDAVNELTAYPKTASATDLMIDAPGEVDPKQLDELHLNIISSK
jgi:hypothetical protein